MVSDLTEETTIVVRIDGEPWTRESMRWKKYRGETDLYADRDRRQEILKKAIHGPLTGALAVDCVFTKASCPTTID